MSFQIRPPNHVWEVFPEKPILRPVLREGQVTMGRKETTGTTVLGEALPRQTGSKCRGKVGRENWVFGTPEFMGSSVRG